MSMAPESSGMTAPPVTTMSTRATSPRNLKSIGCSIRIRCDGYPPAGADSGQEIAGDPTHHLPGATAAAVEGEQVVDGAGEVVGQAGVRLQAQLGLAPP